MFTKIKLFLNNIKKYYNEYNKIKINKIKLTEKEKLFLYNPC